jgi:hypothetical protein
MIQRARFGDKINSVFFDDYIDKVMADREASGLTTLIDRVIGLLVAVEPGHGSLYSQDICLMTSYEYVFSYQSDQFFTHVLRSSEKQPDLFVREPRIPDYCDIFKNINASFPQGAQKPHSRYLGEIMEVSDLQRVVALQKERGIRFFDAQQLLEMDLFNDICFTKPSPYTHNILGYKNPESNYFSQSGIPFINNEIDVLCKQKKVLQKTLGIHSLMGYIDHLATRVYSQNREAAILEWLALTSYYYCGSYEIKSQNSTTNVTKSIHYDSEIFCPAKVFTAARTPYFLNHFHGTPSPTEKFVRDFGPRLHHMAINVVELPP